MGLMVRVTGEKMGDGDQDDRPERCGGERVPEAAAENSELHEDPATDERAYQTENDVCDAAEAAAARDLPREPASDEANQEPADDSVPVLDYEDLRIGEPRRKEKMH